MTRSHLATRRPLRRCSPRLLFVRFAALLLLLGVFAGGRPVCGGELHGRVVDADTGELIPARVYLSNEAGETFFVKVKDPQGTALAYREQWVPTPGATERHTTISAHPFHIELPPGKYTLEVERGKEYHTHRETIELTDAGLDQTIHLRRWFNAAAKGWYSGETHVHRRIHELPNVMLAEDLNVAFPVTFWTTASDAAPHLKPSTLRRQGPSPFGPRVDRGYRPIPVDDTHVIIPRNTEYEIFSVNGKRHVLGALFLLNHRTPFKLQAPPIRPIAELAHREGALLDLDKHSWPWAMMLIPVAQVDLFELSNNSVWRTNFGFKSPPAQPLPWAKLEHEPQSDTGPAALERKHLTEWGWLNYGFEMYYALLNCGFHLSPTAGTASGVHPVPLGYSRVYVHMGDAPKSASAGPSSLDPQRWLANLKAGRSFVTTGPMLLAKVDGTPPGATLQRSSQQDQPAKDLMVEMESTSARALERIDILVNGQVVKSFPRPGKNRLQRRLGGDIATSPDG